MAIIKMKTSADPHYSSAFHGFAELNADLEKEMRQVNVRSKFKNFCNDQSVHPLNQNAPALNYNHEGGVEQDSEFDISVEEFKLFADLYGVAVIPDRMSFLESLNLDEGNTDQISAVVRISQRTDDLNLSDEDLWDPEVVEAVKAAEERRKTRLKKQIPGKLPRLSVSQLAVAIAWEIEVDTGKRVFSGVVMNRLCTLAATDIKPECLLYADSSVPGQERVRWSLKNGSEKWFTKGGCRDALRIWRDSIPQKTVRRS
jgi:hypothetical protein